MCLEGVEIALRAQIDTSRQRRMQHMQSVMQHKRWMLILWRFRISISARALASYAKGSSAPAEVEEMAPAAPSNSAVSTFLCVCTILVAL